MKYEPISDFCPTQVVAEKGCVEGLIPQIAEKGSRMILLTMEEEIHKNELLSGFIADLRSKAKGLIEYDSLKKRLDHEELDSIAYFARKSQGDFLIACGGRETFLATKAIALLSVNSIFAKDLKDSKPSSSRRSLPVITIPFDFSLGEEISPFYSVYDGREKYTLYDKDTSLFPQLTCIDFDLFSMEAKASKEAIHRNTAIFATVFDSVYSPQPNPVSLSSAAESSFLIHNVLTQLASDGMSEDLHQKLISASCSAGASYSAMGGGLCFSLAAALYDLEDLDFSLFMTILFPYVLEYNLLHLGEVESEEEKESIRKNLSYFSTAFQLNSANSEDGASFLAVVQKLYSDIQVPSKLSDLNISYDSLEQAAVRAVQSKECRNSVLKIDMERAIEILRQAY